MDMLNLIFIGVIIVLLIIFKRFLDERTLEKAAKSPTIYQYERKHHIMTGAEADFFDTLVQTVGDTYHVFPQVHLSAILNHTVKGQTWDAAFKHINGKSVDFVLCDKDNLKPVLAIELDDWTHGRDDRRQRDAEVDRIFAGADLPLIHFTDYRKLDSSSITKAISNAII